MFHEILQLLLNLTCALTQHYTHYSPRMSPDNTHKLMGFCMEVLIPGVIL